MIDAERMAQVMDLLRICACREYCARCGKNRALHDEEPSWPCWEKRSPFAVDRCDHAFAIARTYNQLTKEFVV